MISIWYLYDIYMKHNKVMHDIRCISYIYIYRVWLTMWESHSHWSTPKGDGFFHRQAGMEQNCNMAVQVTVGLFFWAQIGRLKYSQDPSRIHPYISDIGAIDSHGFRQKKDRPSVAAETLKRRERDTIGFPGRPGETRSILRSHRNLSGTTGDHYATKIGWPIFSHLRHFMTFWDCWFWTELSKRT